MTQDQGFMNFIEKLELGGWATESSCLLAQAIVTVVVITNLRKHWGLFPIKQLSPLCTSAAAVSFLLVNIVSVLARSLEQYDPNKSYKMSESQECGQCRISGHSEMEVLAIVYLALRQLPLVLFTLKTLRVSICFLDYKSQELPRCLVSFFRRERTILLGSIGYSLLIGLANYIDLQVGGLGQNSATLTFEFFCPKQSGVVDWFATMLRYLLLAVSYTLSIRTYRQLDFKRFIFLVFLLSNTQVILRCIFVFENIDITTYHEFYYHSLFLNLVGTLVLYPYSNFNRYVQQPPGAAVLESFEAFLNYAPGINILHYFSQHRDEFEHTSRYSHCFNHFLSVRQLKMVVTLNPKCIGAVTPHILQILHDHETAVEIPQSLDLREKVSQGDITLGCIKVVEKRLFQFCEKTLFKEWKKTESRAYLENEFKNNLHINEKMCNLGIDI